MPFHSIAIDGPAGAGKSTLAKALSQKLGFLYVDTGALYRSLGLFAVRQGADLRREADVCPLLPAAGLSLSYGEDGLQHVFLDGEDVTQAIRENAVSSYAAAVSALPGVRQFLLETQRKLARENNVIMDGRDIGTVVLPQASLKIFLTAAPEIRAKRRLAELEQRGETLSYESLLQEIRARDAADTQRAIAPLRQAEDAVLLDTSQLDFAQSLAALHTLVKERLSL